MSIRNSSEWSQLPQKAPVNISECIPYCISIAITQTFHGKSESHLAGGVDKQYKLEYQYLLTTTTTNQRGSIIATELGSYKACLPTTWENLLSACTPGVPPTNTLFTLCTSKQLSTTLYFHVYPGTILLLWKLLIKLPPS